ncbi:hypothetical protein K435DRAFT_849914 [Dendrothele bispora CBS 962.96]|uniref:Uncharacterized protein n=1 Tax=Dendrothele bispora (strain CBS 962.96) TaxID=1314807 RepID=A0A4S8MQZ9_DENBC|nr:hypothetical protein K435DRAFT_849914 [Dendrothele bispora CBS 962.96]
MSNPTRKLRSQTKAESDTQGAPMTSTNTDSRPASPELTDIEQRCSYRDVVMSRPPSAAGNGDKENTLGNQEAHASYQFGNATSAEPAMGNSPQNVNASEGQEILGPISTNIPVENDNNNLPTYPLIDSELGHQKVGMNENGQWTKVTRKNNKTHS